jgi:class 3 adenylate cyclase
LVVGVVASVTVSVVFTDLVGSTELSARLGPDDAEVLRQTLFSLLRAGVAAWGGREVKNLGDGLMVVFPSVRAALDGAVSMQQAVEGHNRSGGEALAVRVGLAHGDTTPEDGDFFGEPVVVAARLCAVARGGQILASDVVRVLAGPRGAHRFSPVGEFVLKGIEGPVAAVEVGWEPLADPLGRVGFPARLASAAPEDGFVGRAAQLEVLAEAFKAAAAGKGRQIVLVSGEPGIGKTTLSAAAAGAAYALGACVLYGRCDEELAIC